MGDYREQLALALRQVCKQKKITQKELAERLGVSHSRARHMLAKDANLTIRSLARIADSLNFNISVCLHLQEEDTIVVDLTALREAGKE